MNSFFAANSAGENTELVIQDCIQQLNRAPDGMNFGFIYVTDVIADQFESILNRCKLKTGIQHWAGSLGVGIIASNREMYDQAAISLMLCQFPEDQFSILDTVKNSSELSTHLHTPGDCDTCFALIHADAYNDQSQILIQQLGESIDNCFIAGGLTSSRGAQYQIADKVTTGGISGVLFSSKIQVFTNLSQGCSPLGKKHVITEAQNNIAVQLDNKPALDVLYNDIGEVLARDIEQATNYIFAGLCIPDSDNNDYTVRNLVGINEDERIFAVNDNLIENHELIVCRRDGNTAIQDMLSMLEKLKKRLDSTPKGGIYISCLGRGREQFGDNSEEIKLIHETLGDFPLTGFFANGEIHHNKVYGYTGVLTLFV